MKATDFVWFEGLDDWKPVSEVPELKDCMNMSLTRKVIFVAYMVICVALVYYLNSTIIKPLLNFVSPYLEIGHNYLTLIVLSGFGILLVVGGIYDLGRYVLKILRK